ncbi:complement C1q-like protein 4 [Aplochiton taeniatus]
MRVSGVLSVLALAGLCVCVLGQRLDGDAAIRAELMEMKDTVTQLKAAWSGMKKRLDEAEKELKELKETPKVAFAASLGGNGLRKSGFSNENLVYKDVLTNVGGAYNQETGVFTAPVRGVYYMRFTANSPTETTMSSVLYKNGMDIVLIAHEQPSGPGSDTASNGAALLLEQGDTLHMVLWPNTQIWDNSNHHSTFSGFLLFPMAQ